MKNFVRQFIDILNTVTPVVNFELTIKRKTYLIRNVFKTNHKKRALVIYLTDPFINKFKNKHTNHSECFLGCEVLDGLGFQVDVIDYDDNRTLNFSDYSLIYGFGEPFEKSFYCKNYQGKRIVYSPGCNTVYSNKVSAKRLKEFTLQNGDSTPYLVRTTNNAWPLQKYLSDAIICQGNDFVLNTYKDDYKLTTYYKINCFPLERELSIPIEHKDFSKIKYNLLWFGSQGCIHKGLDIALALADKYEDIKLYIRGIDMKKESIIFNNYKHLIANNRVDVKEYVDVKSNEFEELMMNCGGAIFPSASEGGAAALLTIMTYGGLIPIITKSCGLDVENIGFVAESTSIDSVEQSLLAYFKLNHQELKLKCINTQKEILKVYNRENYKKNLHKSISNILS